MDVCILATWGWLKKLVNPCLHLKGWTRPEINAKRSPPLPYHHHNTGWLATSLVMDISLSSVCVEVKGCCYCTQTQLMLLEGLLRYGDGGGGCSHSITHRPLVSANNFLICIHTIYSRFMGKRLRCIVQTLREGRYPRASHKCFWLLRFCIVWRRQEKQETNRQYDFQSFILVE